MTTNVNVLRNQPEKALSPVLSDRKTYPRRPRPAHTNRRVDPESPESRIVVHVVMLSRASHALRRAVAFGGAVAPAAHSHTARRLLATQAAAKAMGVVRHDWTNEEVEALYNRPLLDLVYDAASVHRANHDPRQVQQCTLLSIKTGGCPETCNYCAQSSTW